MRIAVIGLGYVGCVAAAKLSISGHKVIGVDINQVKVNLVNKGEPTVVEPGLDVLFATAKESGNLRATTVLKEAVHEADVYYLCVSTPLGPDGDLDISAIFRVAEEIKNTLDVETKQKTLIIRSTVKPGTNAILREMLKEKNVSIVMNPEFLREGKALDDWDSPGLIVIGAFDDYGKKVIEKMYTEISAPFFCVKPETAEIIKYVNNSWHALKVSFANEIGRLCKDINIDHEELMDIFLADEKLNISRYYLRPGMPYGGSCLTKDLSALTFLAHEQGVPVPVLEAVEKSNDRHASHIIEMICRYDKKRIGVLGLAFKKETDDLRYSPSIAIIRGLLNRGMIVRIYDPNVRLEQLTGQNKEYVMDFLPALKEAMAPSFDAMVSQVDLVVVAHDIGKRMEHLRQSYPAKTFLEMFRFKC